MVAMMIIAKRKKLVVVVMTTVVMTTKRNLPQKCIEILAVMIIAKRKKLVEEKLMKTFQKKTIVTKMTTMVLTRMILTWIHPPKRLKHNWYIQMSIDIFPTNALNSFFLLLKMSFVSVLNPRPKAKKNLLSKTLDTYNGKKTPQELPQIVADNLMKGTIDASGFNNFKELCKKETGDPDEVLSYVFYKSSVTGKWQRSGVLRDDLQALLRLQSIHKRLLCQYCHLVKNFIDAHYENVEQLIDVYDCSFFLEYYLSIDERPIELGIDKHRELTKRNILGKQDVIIVMSDTSATHFFTVVYQPERKKIVLCDPWDSSDYDDLTNKVYYWCAAMVYQLVAHVLLSQDKNLKEPIRDHLVKAELKAWRF